MTRNNTIRQLAGWYFNKRVLPYWCLLLMDAKPMGECWMEFYDGLLG